jgi:hypothetical protein
VMNLISSVGQSNIEGLLELDLSTTNLHLAYLHAE